MPVSSKFHTFGPAHKDKQKVISLSFFMPAANSFLAEFFHNEFFRITFAMARYLMPGFHGFKHGFLLQTAVNS